MKASCVTISIIAFKSLFKLSNLSSNNLADFESSAPVGSSASTSDEFVTIALADATLCFCPPDIWYGYLFNAFSISRYFATYFTLESILDGFSPFIVRANAIFS